jgi:hypothetical protein
MFKRFAKTRSGLRQCYAVMRDFELASMFVSQQERAESLGRTNGLSAHRTLNLSSNTDRERTPTQSQLTRSSLAAQSQLRQGTNNYDRSRLQAGSDHSSLTVLMCVCVCLCACVRVRVCVCLCVPPVLVTLLCASHRAELFAADSTLQAALEARGYAETIATTKKHKGVVQPRGLSLSLATHFRLTPGATGGRALGATLGALCLSPALSLSLSLSSLFSRLLWSVRRVRFAGRAGADGTDKACRQSN